MIQVRIDKVQNEDAVKSYLDRALKYLVPRYIKEYPEIFVDMRPEDAKWDLTGEVSIAHLLHFLDNKYSREIRDEGGNLVGMAWTLLLTPDSYAIMFRLIQQISKYLIKDLLYFSNIENILSNEICKRFLNREHLFEWIEEYMDHHGVYPNKDDQKTYFMDLTSVLRCMIALIPVYSYDLSFITKIIFTFLILKICSSDHLEKDQLAKKFRDLLYSLHVNHVMIRTFRIRLLTNSINVYHVEKISVPIAEKKLFERHNIPVKSKTSKILKSVFSFTVQNVK